MVFFRKLLLAVVASGVLSLGSASRAGVIYDNLPPLSSSGGTDPVAYDGPLYNSFSTGGSASQLLDVKLMLSATSGDQSSFTVNLLSDSSSTPGSLFMTLGTFNDSTLGSDPSVYDIFFAPFDLTANTRYWVEVSSATSLPSVVAWDYAANITGRGIAGEFSATTQGTSPSVTANTHATAPYLMQVTTSQSTDEPVVIDPTPPVDPTPPDPPTSSVPEPGTLCQALTAVAIGSVVFARRRMIRS